MRIAGWLRNGWRQLTSMRTALVLLFLLALAAIPGSILPQRSVSVGDVRQWYEQRPDLAPLVDRLGGFDVYASPWFSAIYLLLFVSLVGCVVPRMRDHVRALRAAPVDAPRRLSRLPQHANALSVAASAEPGTESPDPAGDSARSDGSAAAGAALHAGLRSRRWRSVVRSHEDGTVTVSAEKGYLKETGNLLMHTAMVAVLVGVALGSWYGWHGNRVVVAGPDTRFCNVLQQYDEYGLGSRVGGADLPPFCFTLTGFDAEFTDDGHALSYLARGEVSEAGGAPRPVDFTVNSPLRLDGANMYLLGNGYAPILRYTDRYGVTLTTTAPFLPIDSLGTAEGTAMFRDANVDPEGNQDPDSQVALQGLYLPTAPADSPVLVQSAHPEERAPRLMLIAYRGDLGIDDGTPQSVWSLDADQLASGALAPVGQPAFLSPGETMTLDDGTTVEFVGTQRWISVSVRHDPGQPIVLAGAGLMLAGLLLSLTGRRRRVWFRVTTDSDGRSLVEAGGLPRTDYPGFDKEFTGLIEALTTEPTPAPVPAGRSR